jgi:hypothetical protein
MPESGVASLKSRIRSPVSFNRQVLQSVESSSGIRANGPVFDTTPSRRGTLGLATRDSRLFPGCDVHTLSLTIGRFKGR